jgi:hypothetical protein
VYEEVALLRERLNECRGEDWQRANAIFKEICRLCDHKGAKDGIGSPYPRACKFCNRYGHSTQFCKAKKAYDEAREKRSMDKIMAEERERRARGCTLPQYWCDRFAWSRARHKAALDAGLEGCVVDWEEGKGPCSLEGIPLGKRCKGCEEWNAFMKERDASVPWRGGDAPMP